ncbi:sulfotransferase family protein [Thalassomonas sp. M1454]|uniref:sulfotransferase family protein n=1 Tax=Thalassomonas sp. M1454 TaxID=2594477 RepID=UPI001180668E|nr:sulfotransferase [Thalassomonas sp. M1454]TRX57944.1 sulfotransferase [Thalassomonas sp. M1454]
MRNLFIIGSPRSGTTYLAKYLQKSSYGKAFETHFIIKYYKNLYRYKPLHTDNLKRLLKDLSTERYVKQWNIKLNSKEIPIAKNDLDTYLNLVNYICNQIRISKHWADKTPHYIHDWGLLDRLFPQARYIYIIRDGRDVALSLLKKSWGPNNIYTCAKLWSEQNNNFEMVQKLEREQRILIVKYEDLIQSPKSTSSLIMSFIGEEHDEKFFEEIKSNTLSANYNKWQQKLSKAELNVFNFIAFKELNFWGYKTSEYTTPPSKLQIIRYRVHDFILYWCHHIKQNTLDWLQIKLKIKQPFNQ